MPNILKSRRVNLVDEVVQIRDMAPRRKKPKPRPEGEPEPADFTELDLAGMEDGAPGEDFDRGPAAEYTDDYQFESPQIKEEIIQSAMGEAGRIMEEALHKAEEARGEILAKAQFEAEQMKKEALEEGRKQGFSSVISEVNQIATGVEDAIAAFEGERAGFEVEYEEQLKWLAVEIASKVLAKKVADDDAEMLEMVNKAMQSVRGESWVKVEVAGDMTHLLDRLAELYKNQENIDVVPSNGPPGSVMIESPSGVVDASLQTQLLNLKNYFQQAALS